MGHHNGESGDQQESGGAGRTGPQPAPGAPLDGEHDQHQDQDQDQDHDRPDDPVADDEAESGRGEPRDAIPPAREPAEARPESAEAGAEEDAGVGDASEDDAAARPGAAPQTVSLGKVAPPPSPGTVSLGSVAHEDAAPLTVSLGPVAHEDPAPRTVTLGKGELAAHPRDEPADADAAADTDRDADTDAVADAEPGTLADPDDAAHPVPPPDRHETPHQPLEDVPHQEAPTGSGRLLAGRYRLGAVVGRGGMGTVWRATDEVLARQVAVKELRLSSVIDDAERRRLVTRTLREAKAIATIRGRGVVTVFDVVDEEDRPWIVMELIEGRSLADVIRDDGTLTVRRAAEVGLAVLDVLSAAHRAGIVHRDVKPSNVLVADADGRVVLTDFGIAKADGDPSITSTGMLVGAPSYISPERARGDDLSPAADYWSLGALLYCALEGRPPYDRGGAISTLAAVMNDPVEVPESAGALAEVIAGLLQKDPEERFDEPVTRALLREALGRARRADGAHGAHGTMALGAAAA
uniref:serine/threonine protein kinase n=2 Tax=unclassified Streptomyces TaxID=2593676 RepID=UPI0015E1A685